MKLLKNIALGLVLATASVSVSSIAVAATIDEDGRAVYTPVEAIDTVVAKIAEADHAINQGSHPSSDIVDIIKSAMKLSKEINASDAVDVKRQRANGHLKKARTAVKKGHMDQAKGHLATATTAFTALKGIL